MRIKNISHSILIIFPIVILLSVLFFSINTGKNKLALQEDDDVNLTSTDIDAMSLAKKNSSNKYLSKDKFTINQSISYQFEHSDNLYGLAISLLNKSNDGNAVAQFYLAKILQVCKGAIGLLNRKSSSETNLQLQISDWYALKCAEFDLNNIKVFGEVNDWIKLSAKSNYGPSMVAELIQSNSFSQDEDTLSKLRMALSSKLPETIALISGLSNKRITREAWILLACDFGYDCSDTSMQPWRISLAAKCALNQFDSEYGKYCNQDVEYKDYIKLKYNRDNYNKIVKCKNHFNKLLLSNLIHKFTFNDFLSCS